ncbi:MAG TPA: glutamate-1-semialdehyde 2,1-aminomutase [Cyclobacteriaceae bacterium]|jgi:glutamate-1-semialdehyde 2,1-aminomutase|nr:glutamate-1-semialdehyde 2,1-aminomutase [Cyclobacteriaceae bacterium]
MSISEKLFEEAQRYIPGGVNSPVRAFKQVGGTPIFMKSANGAHLFDADGNQYIDYINSWGPMILGHSHPKVVAALQEQAATAVSFGAPTEQETSLAKLITQMVPGVDLIRFVNSGTEACMSALRLARGYTHRSKFIKFEGHYHGHSDPFLKKAGSGMATLNIKVNAGIPSAVVEDTLVASFNDFEEAERLFIENKNDIAAIIVEPVPGNMGCVIPKHGYLRHLRNLCDKYGAVLIFDEVMTGFRLSRGGAQELFDIQADLVTFGKVIGGGLPVGAFGGKKEIMSKIAPLGEVYQAGTLSGNPLAMVAGYTTLSMLNENIEIYNSLHNKTEYLEKGLKEVLTKKGLPFVINRIGSMISVHFCENEVVDFKSATAGNNDAFKKFFHGMLKNGVYLPPSPFETWFLSEALTQDDLDKTIEAAAKSI